MYSKTQTDDLLVAVFEGEEKEQLITSSKK